MIYILLIVFCTFMAYFSTKYKFVIKNGIKINLLGYISLLAVVFVAGFRGVQVGTDTSGTYLNIFNIAHSNIKAIRDIGYGIINYICYGITHNYTFLLVIISLLTYGLVFYRIFHSSKIPWYSIFLFFSTDFFFISMNMIRQSIVLALLIFIFPFIHSNDKRDIFFFWVVTCIGVLIHTSGLVFIPIFFVFRHLKLTPKTAVIITFFNIFLNSIFNKFVIAILFRFYYFRQYFGWYFSSVYNNGEKSIIGTMIPFSILLFWAGIYTYGLNSKNNIVLNDLGISMLIAGNLMIYSDTIPLINRIAVYFTTQVIILIPNIISILKRGTVRNCVMLVIFICYALYMYITIFIQRQEGVLPYTNVLFGG